MIASGRRRAALYGCVIIWMETLKYYTFHTPRAFASQSASEQGSNGTKESARAGGASSVPACVFYPQQTKFVLLNTMSSRVSRADRDTGHFIVLSA